MPKVSKDHLEKRRTEILEAAWRCFERKGFHQTTMRDICAEAQLSPGAVYQYFDGKSAIIHAVAAEGRRLHTEQITPAETAEAPTAALADSLERFLRCLDDPASRSSLRVEVRLFAEALHEDEVRGVILENYDSVIGLFAKLVQRGQEAGAIDAGPSPEAVARLVVALFQGIELQKAIDPEVNATELGAVARALLRGTLTKPSPQDDHA